MEYVLTDKHPRWIGRWVGYLVHLHDYPLLLQSTCEDSAREEFEAWLIARLAATRRMQERECKQVTDVVPGVLNLAQHGLC